VTDGLYEYAVTAVNAFGFESQASEPLEVGVGDLEPPLPVVLTGSASGFDVELTWTASASPDVVRYDVYRDGVKIVEHTDLGQLLHLDAGLANGLYTYVVRALDGAGNESPESNAVPVSVWVAPAFPLSVSVVPEGQALDLLWQPDAGLPAASFRLWRSPAAGGPYAELLETTVTTLRDAPLLDGSAYFYTVVALDGTGLAIAVSNEASGTPQDAVAPAPPDLHHPTAPGVPLTVRDGATVLAGSAEAGATVEFSGNGVPLAVAPAAPETAVATGTTPPFGSRRLSPDGETLWGLTFDLDGNPTWLLHHLANGHDEVVLQEEDGARWSADSRRLVFATPGGEIRAYDVVRREVEALAATDEVDLVVPSPAVDRLAVIGEHAGQSGVWIVDLPNGQWTRVSSLRPWNQPLEWSTTGDHIAFGYSGSLYLVDVASGASTLLTNSLGTGAPSWSPDGQALLYPVRGGGLDQVWRRDLATGTSQQVTVEPGGASRPQWSPDGRRFAYRRGTRQVVAVEWATGSVETLYETAGACSPCTLQWVAGGSLWIDVGGSAWLRWSPRGLARSSLVPLEPGTTTLTAIARDAAGNVSAPSTPIEVEWASPGAADLAIGAADLLVLPGAPPVGGGATASVTVHNIGASPSSPSELLAFVQGPGGFLASIFTAEPLPALPPGGAASFSGSVALGTAPGTYELVAAADPFERVEEATESNNLAALAFPVVPPGGLFVGVATDLPLYEPGDSATVMAEVAYGGDPLTGRLQIRVEDAASATVETVLDEPVSLDYGDLETWEVTWPAGSVFAGLYQAVAELSDELGQTLGEATASFAIAESFELDVEVAPSLPSYPEGELVRFTGGVTYVEGNVLLADLTAELELLGPAGQLVESWGTTIGPLLPGAQATLVFDWSSVGTEPGTYQARFDLLRNGTVQATAQTTVAIEPPEAGFSGSLTLDSHAPPFGVPLGATVQVTNESALSLTAVPVRLRLIDPAAGAVLERREWVVDLAPGTVFEAAASFDTANLEPVEYLVQLVVESPLANPPEEVTLAAETFLPVDRTPPDLTLLQPAEAGFLGAVDPFARAAADDERSGIAEVEVRLDAGAWMAMAPADPAAGTFAIDLSALAEGPHAVEARATDGAGNAAMTAPTAFTADWTPPAIEIRGVEDAGVYEETVTPLIDVVEAHPGSEEFLLDGEPFVSGTPITEPGDHLLEVAAEDAAGNPAEVVLAFTLVLPGEPLDLVVNTVNDVDDGSCSATHCSLREALLAANAHPSFDVIRFAVPGLGVERVIALHTPLPPVRQPVWIDGPSQPGSICDGAEPRPAIVLDGSLLGDGDGLVLETLGATVRGMTLRRFPGHGLRLRGGGGHSLACLRLGDDGSGNATSGNGGHGALLEAGTTGNSLGADAEEGVCAAPCNVIGFNGGAGIALSADAGPGNALRRNRVHANEALGIDLGDDGLTLNDEDDSDAGPNDLQNYPAIAAVRPGESSEVDVILLAAPERSVVVDLFRVAAANAGRDGSAGVPPFGEGDVYLGSAALATDVSGRGAVTVGVPYDLATSAVTVTATDLDTGSTSEFSPAFVAHFTHALIASLRAYATADGEGIVEWTTSSEAGTIGFDLYRAARGERGHGWHKVNGGLVPALVEAPAGARYRVGVPALPAGAAERFVLVEVEAGGARRLLGPFDVTIEAAPQGASEVASGYSRRTLLPAAPMRWPASPGTAWETAVPAPAAKIGIRATAGTRLTAAAIATALGTDESTVRLGLRTGQVRLTTRGSQVAWLAARDGSSLLFYGREPEDPYSPENVYRLTLESGQPMARWNGGAPQAQPGGTFQATAAFEENAFAATIVALDPDEDFWFWRGLSAGDPVYGTARFDFDLPGLDPRGNGGTVTVELYGASALGIEGEHVVEARVNGVSLGATSWSGIGWHEASFEMPGNLLVDASNELELVAVPVPGVPYSFAYVNRFETSYPRRFEAHDGQLLLASEGHTVVTVDGFADRKIVVLDVTEPDHPVHVTHARIDTGTGYRVSFVPAPGARWYWTADATGISSPASTETDVPSDLHSPEHAVDLLVVSTPPLLEAAAPLLELRRAQGLRLLEVDLADVYDEFNDGLASPRALEQLLQHAAQAWEVPPRWLLLVGAGTYDYRDHLELGGNLVPPLLERTPAGLFSADPLLGDVVGGDGIPEVAVGRIPAKTVAEVQAYAAKVVAYESQGAEDWLDRAVLVADDRDGAANFGADALGLVEALPPGASAVPLLLDELDVAALRAALFGELAAGAGLVHYLGHGGVDRLAGEPILAGPDVPALANAPRLPVALAPTCVAARHEIPSFRSLGELLVVEPDGGAVAVLSSSGLSQHGRAVQLSQSLVSEAWSRFGEESLGEALLGAYSSYIADGGSAEALGTLTLLGDPSLRRPE
jgi:CSLREA domain-containing protein